MTEMTREILNSLSSLYPLQDYEEQAIEDALQSEPHWIPVTEGLPKESGSFQVTTTHGKVAIYFFVADSISSHEYWERSVIAWMPLPEPYQEGEQDE